LSWFTKTGDAFWMHDVSPKWMKQRCGLRVIKDQFLLTVFIEFYVAAFVT